MSQDVTVTISQTPNLITSVTLVEDDFPVQVGYDENDVIVGTLAEVLSQGNNGGDLQIKNIAAPSLGGDAVNKTHLDAQVSAAVNAEATARINADLTEATSRTNADSALQGQITVHTASIASQGVAIAAEIVTRAANDDDEAETRAANDSDLQTSIDNILEILGTVGNNIKQTYLIPEAMDAGQLVYVSTGGAIRKYDTTNPAIVGKPVGIIPSAIEADQELDVYFAGLVYIQEAILSVGSIYYSDDNGALTLTPSRLFVGVAITSTTLLLRFQNLSWNDLFGKPSIADVQVFSSAVTTEWVKPVGATRIWAMCLGGGAGAGSGRKGAAATIRCGGGGGASGQVAEMWFNANALPSSVTLVVGAGGSGGASVSANSTNGNNGSQGSASVFGAAVLSAAYFGASGGTQGIGGTASTGSGGSASTTAITANSNAGASASVSGGNGGVASSINHASSGGGAGGGITNVNVASNGSVGGTMGQGGEGLAGGVAGVVNTNGGNGNASTITYRGTGAGGGGASTIGNAGNGGNGVAGSGGAGGGAATDSVGNSGAGGNGGTGMVVVITYFT